MNTYNHLLQTKPLATSPSEEIEKPNALRQFVFGDFHTHHFQESPWLRAPKEVGCALAASLLVSPLVSIIDKSIVQDVSSTQKFAQAMTNSTKEMLFTPKAFFGGLSFRLTAIVYFGTYAVANLSELFLDLKKIKEDTPRKSIKVAASAAANIGLLAWRDSVFAREFSTGPKRATPMRTLSLFAARDAATMYATFYAAPRAADYLQQEYGVEKYTAEFSMALTIPMITQVITAPFHIHAMDYYAKPDSNFAQRMAVLRGEFAMVSFARSFRILPAFGIGSFSNNRFREYCIRHTYDPEPVPGALQRRVTQAVQGMVKRFKTENK